MTHDELLKEFYYIHFKENGIWRCQTVRKLMTHDELLAVVNDYETGLSNGMVRKENVFAVAKAFRAIAELHKPETYDYNEETVVVCRCQQPTTGEQYPCPTIQAIEKELM